MLIFDSCRQSHDHAPKRKFLRQEFDQSVRRQRPLATRPMTPTPPDSRRHAQAVRVAQGTAALGRAAGTAFAASEGKHITAKAITGSPSRQPPKNRIATPLTVNGQVAGRQLHCGFAPKWQPHATLIPGSSDGRTFV